MTLLTAVYKQYEQTIGDVSNRAQRTPRSIDHAFVSQARSLEELRESGKIRWDEVAY